PTVISLILAGKCASMIASEIGSQKISEQIDAMEVMGVNTANYLILPKIFACFIFFPLLI
ncbi:MAG TPA: ABC transporter permease, partial [Bacteroidales bacterium]|nr:ABC transporter permease [Bacteroidales bacterium]